VRIKIAALRSDLKQVIDGVRLGGPVIVVRHGEPVAALVSVQDLAELTRLRGVYRTFYNRQSEAVVSSELTIG